jgi:hypothetical protein
MGSVEVLNTPVSPLRQLCEHAKVSDEAKSLVTAESSTKPFLGLLVEKEMFRDALRLVAFLLPKREAIGWGCLCVRHVFAAQKDQLLPPALAAAERWVYGPSEENRWAAREAADQEQPRTASGLLAMAVFLAGPSLAPPHVQAVPPPDHLASQMVAKAVAIAGLAGEGGKAKERYASFMQKAFALIARMQQSAQA